MKRFSKIRPGLLVCSGLRACAQRHAQIHSAVLAERRNRFASLGVDGRQVSGVQIQQPAILAVPALPVVEPPRADRALVRMAPQLLSRRRIERDDRVAGALYHHVVDDDRVERDIPGHRMRPGDLELRNVGFIDLVERRILRRVGASLIGGPGRVGLRTSATVRARLSRQRDEPG